MSDINTLVCLLYVFCRSDFPYCTTYYYFFSFKIVPPAEVLDFHFVYARLLLSMSKSAEQACRTGVVLFAFYRRARSGREEFPSRVTRAPRSLRSPADAKE